MFPAELPERRIGDPRHRREHDRWIDGDLPINERLSCEPDWRPFDKLRAQPA